MECLTVIRDGHGAVLIRTRGFNAVASLMYSCPFRPSLLIPVDQEPWIMRIPSRRILHCRACLEEVIR